MKQENEARLLIVNADDFGLTSGVNRGIIEAHERGVVTSASLMVRYPAALEAAEYARAHQELSVGLHFDVAEWRYKNGNWEPAYQVIDVTDSSAVQAEFDRQLARFQELMQRPPTHLDSHQHAHLSLPLRGLLSRQAQTLGIPLRNCVDGIAHCGGFYGQTDEGEFLADGTSPQRLVRLIETLPGGWTEIGCHPGYVDGLDSVYRLGREKEIRALCCTAVRDALERAAVQLRSFHDFNRAQLADAVTATPS